MNRITSFILSLLLLNAWTDLLTEGELQCHDLGVLTVENSICGCIGETLLYSCTVSGGVSTVWQGSTFDNCRITLLHSHFVSGRETSGTCNHGSIVARSAWYSINYSTNISYYTSYLTVAATPDLNNTDIQCLLHINSQSFVPIESYNISIISEYALSPPTDIYLSHVNYSHISFAWTPPVSHCQSSTFFVYTSNCGECPSLVDKNEMTCTDMVVDGSMCSFHIQRTACSNNITGKNSSTFSIIPKVPDRPNVRVTLHYNAENLTSVEVQISSDSLSQEPFGQTTHTIDYVDAISGYKCASNTIEVSSCQGSKCTSIFEPSTSCMASSTFNITAFTNNSFGAGQESQPITIDLLNRFLNVTFDSLSGRIICNFHEECDCTCNIEYGICNNRFMTLGYPLGTTGQLKPEETRYCYSASATIARLTVVVTVNGEINSDSMQKQNNSQAMTECSCNIHLTVIYAMGITIIASLITLFLVVIALCTYIRSRLRIQTINTESISPIYDDLQDIKETSIYADKNVAYSTS